MAILMDTVMVSLIILLIASLIKKFDSISFFSPPEVLNGYYNLHHYADNNTYHSISQNYKDDISPNYGNYWSQSLFYLSPTHLIIISPFNFHS